MPRCEAPDGYSVDENALESSMILSEECCGESSFQVVAVPRRMAGELVFALRRPVMVSLDISHVRISRAARNPYIGDRSCKWLARLRVVDIFTGRCAVVIQEISCDLRLALEPTLFLFSRRRIGAEDSLSLQFQSLKKTVDRLLVL